MHEPVIAKRVDNLNEKLNPGSFRWYSTPEHAFVALGYICPCGCNTPHALALIPPNHFIWDGDTECPTLSPKITILEIDGETVHWEGWLRHGRWINTREMML